MAYIAQEQKKEKALLIKPLLKEFGLKGSLSINHYSTLSLNIRSGKLDFLGEFNEYSKKEEMKHLGDLSMRHRDAENLSISNSWQTEKYSAKLRDFLTKAMAILMTGNHDRSDSQADYFDVGWYIDINIGKWDKPYELIK